MRRRIALAASVAAVLALTSCSAGGAQAPADTSATGDELVTLARQEGQVIWYTGSLPPAVEAVQKAFKATYGIDVVVPERLSSAALAQRLDADVRGTGSLGADVILTTDMALAGYLGEKGYSVPLQAGMFPGLNTDFVQPTSVGCGVVVPVVAYNKAVLGDFRIDSWNDLLDPRLSGKIMVNDPRGSAAWSQLFSTLLNDPRQGEKFFTGLKAQNYQPVASSLVGAEQLIAGQGGVLVAGTPALFTKAIKAGQPIEMWYPTDPAPVALDACLVAKGAKHPNAAKLFLQWLMTKEGQAAVTIPDAIASPLGDVPGAVVSLPANYTKAPAPGKVSEDLPRVQQLLGFH